MVLKCKGNLFAHIPKHFGRIFRIDVPFTSDPYVFSCSQCLSKLVVFGDYPEPAYLRIPFLKENFCLILVTTSRSVLVVAGCKILELYFCLQNAELGGLFTSCTSFHNSSWTQPMTYAIFFCRRPSCRIKSDLDRITCFHSHGQGQGHQNDLPLDRKRVNLQT